MLLEFARNTFKRQTSLQILCTSLQILCGTLCFPLPCYHRLEIRKLCTWNLDFNSLFQKVH